jgi:hypothetical protein
MNSGEFKYRPQLVMIIIIVEVGGLRTYITKIKREMEKINGWKQEEEERGKRKLRWKREEGEENERSQVNRK